MGRVEASGIVEAEAEELFHFTDWCYNDPVWAPSISKAWITKLPDSSGLGKVSHYVGTIMGRKAEWEGESTNWKPNEVWGMKAITGPPAKMKMQNEMRFEKLGPGKTRVRFVVEYHAPYPIVGIILDRLYLRSKAQVHARNAIEGMKSAQQRKVPSLLMQFEKRKSDHPGYRPPDL
ncbi:MAG TPA: hypothetical protein VGR53_10050 [Nitrososphaerales archaeon]|nr:hypothetical protein [Nitrososphaerales archaeon]